MLATIAAHGPRPLRVSATPFAALMVLALLSLVWAAIPLPPPGRALQQTGGFRMPASLAIMTSTRR